MNETAAETTVTIPADWVPKAKVDGFVIRTGSKGSRKEPGKTKIVLTKRGGVLLMGCMPGNRPDYYRPPTDAELQEFPEIRRNSNTKVKVRVVEPVGGKQIRMVDWVKEDGSREVFFDFNV